MIDSKLLQFLFLTILAGMALASSGLAWWDPNYTVRQPITIDTTSEGADISTDLGVETVLVRLHQGNFQFLTALEDGSDIRFIAADDKTPLAFHIEKYDSLLNEAFVWVKVPDLKPGAKTPLWVYYGSQTPGAGGADAKATYDEETALVYHFAEPGTPPMDATGNGHNAEGVALPAQGALIGSGIRMDGTGGLTTTQLTWPASGPVTASVWVRPSVVQGKRAVLSYGDSSTGCVLGLEEGVPFVEVTNAGATARTPAGTALPEAAWHHLAFVASGGSVELFVNGLSVGKAEAALPALEEALRVGKLAGEGDAVTGFVGEMDELRVSKAARSPGDIRLAAQNQGASEAAGRVLVLGELASNAAGHSATLEHVMLFGDIARNMMFDGWIAVGVCVIMIIFGWGVAIQKFIYLNSIQKGSDAFMRQWHTVSSDLTVLDHDDEESVKSMGQQVDKTTLRHMHRSPLYHLYHIGSEEIRHRVGNGKDRSKGLSARSIQAIRASLETGLVRENQRMNKGLVLLTISIAGGPYVGLLGTVVGVMITFALIAKTGEVEVNSIAPGIASALLATVAGLVVAIPALFIYSFLNSRIRDLLAGMQVFIDEFIAKMAEFYPTPAEAGPALRQAHDSSPVHREVEPKPVTSNHHAS